MSMNGYLHFSCPICGRTKMAAISQINFEAGTQSNFTTKIQCKWCLSDLKANFEVNFMGFDETIAVPEVFTAVESSHIHSVAYDYNNQVLFIKFKSNPDMTYRYTDIEVKTFCEFLGSSSKGEYYAKNIKRKR